jgi:hypothetical protein
MGKQFDELAKALANGTSRRAALKRFAVGAVGAAAAIVMPGRSAQAQIDFPPLQVSECSDYCRELGLKGRAYGQCVSECAACRKRGGTLIHTNNGGPFCMPAHKPDDD